ncbi:MAG: DUF4367 domain-containing protein [Methanofollis sp.]|uniref:DUF4367 domain-containing protein n=1 Tax=Methanofollis sp. TaxID=2052835 RepID=UPI00262E0A36|nr:DUF4367 domain-containing protein [Methanofollis sp.]MDD4254200.1 DUF4367 domain-containing protein [Methanofollis sp.]
MRPEYLFLLLVLPAVLVAGCTGDTTPPVIPENWSADVTVEGEGAAVTLGMVTAGDERFRVTFPDGTLITDDGRRLWTSDPVAGEISVILSEYRGTVLDERTWLIWNVFRARKVLEGAYEKGNLTYKGMETEDGRTVRVVEIAGNESLGEAPTRFRDPVYRIRASADSETGVLAGATFYGRDGRELARFTFRDMVADPEVPPGTFSFVPPHGTEVRLARTFAVTPMVFVDRTKIPEEVPVPSYLPPGYAFREGYLLPGMYAVLTFTNSAGDILTLVARPADLPDPDHPRGTPEEVTAGNFSGRLYRGDGPDVLAWTDGETSFKLTGVAGEDEMVRVAASVEALS